MGPLILKKKLQTQGALNYINFKGLELKILLPCVIFDSTIYLEWNIEHFELLFSHFNSFLGKTALDRGHVLITYDLKICL
ncbi:hypothetical protein CI610_02864 [invertebrate metagenome]|uniref:Uncharacterized protein n=1 Tax=invertebrate metagenome TaxID=1711999 RepID=A0A2H9T4S5_9ZZZZ